MAETQHNGSSRAKVNRRRLRAHGQEHTGEARGLAHPKPQADQEATDPPPPSSQVCGTWAAHSLEKLTPRAWRRQAWGTVWVPGWKQGA